MSTNKTTFNSEEELRLHFQSIHDYIRNKFGFFGKTALQFFNFLFVLKLIEPEINKGYFQSISDCLYSKLKDANTGGLRNELLADYRKSIYQNSKNDGKQLKDTIFMINSFSDFNDKNDYLRGLLEKIDLLTPDVLDKYHVHGRVYEYFLGFITQKNKGNKSGSQIDDLGQYFTSRKIVRYCMKKVDPVMLDDKNVHSMGDFFCGSGGFITEYIRFLEYKYPNKIKWTKQSNKIFGADTDRDIIKSARVDIMLLTKTFGKSNNSIISNIKRLDSTFDDDFDGYDDSNNYIYTKVFYNFTNPPYGGDKGKDKNDKVQLSNANEQIKHVAVNGTINIPVNLKKIKELPVLIKGDNKETLALLHGMSVLETNGVYCGVLKEGVFFDQKYKTLRTQLIKNYEIEWVISVPQSDFWNTLTKTSILIFKNSGKKTTQIKFCELKEIKNSDNFNEINPQTNKIIGEFNPDNYLLDIKPNSDYMIVKYEDLKQKNYSLNYKDYIVQNIKVNEGFKIVKLGDICEMKSGFAFKSEEFIEKGIRLVQVNNIKDNCIIKKEEDKYIEENINYDKYIINKGDIIIAITGSYGDKIAIYNSNEKAYLNQNMCILTGFEDSNISTYFYLYWIYGGLVEKIKFNANGSTLKFISKEFIKNLQIPVPIDTSTIKLYLDYLNPANETLQTLQTLQTQKEKAICGLIKMLTSFGTNGVEWDEYAFSDLTEFQKKSIKYRASDAKEKGKCKFYTSSQNKIMYIDDEPLFTNEMLIMGRNGNSSIHYDKNFSCEHDHVYVIKCNILLTSTRYMYYYIKSQLEWYNFNMNGSTIGGTSKEFLNKQKIRVLKPHIISKYKLQEDFDFMDKLKSDILNTLKNQENVTKQMMKLVLDGDKDLTNISETNKIIPDNLEIPEELNEPLNTIKPDLKSDLNSNSSSNLEQNKKKSKKSNKNVDIIEEIDSEIKI